MSHKEIKQRLAFAFMKAKADAQAAGNVEDRGCFNFDTVVIRIPKVPRRILNEAAVAAGCQVEPYRRGSFFLFSTTGALCNRRTVMMEAAAESLRGNPDFTAIPGAQVEMYYRLD